MNEVATQEEREKISTAIARRGIDDFTWKTLNNSTYPGARAESILMVLDYCKARNLDPLKKPCHIVPMSVKNARSGEYEWRDVILPGIYEYRTTAMKTGLYMGHSDPEYGEAMEYKGQQVPRSCTMRFKRWNQIAKQIIEFPVTVYYNEVVGLDKNGNVNSRWMKAPVQMLTKCTEAAGLREAFPDELGGLQTDDELAGTVIEVHDTPAPQVEHTRPSAATEALRRAAGKVQPEKEPARTEAQPDKGLSSAAELAKTVKTQAKPAKGKAAKEAAAPEPDPNDDSQHRTKEGMAKMIARFQSLTSIKALEAQWADVKTAYHDDTPIDVEAAYREHLESLENAGIG